MTTRAMGPAAGWTWLLRAINLGRSNPRAIFGAVALVAVLVLIPSVLQLILQSGFGMGPDQVVMALGAVTIVSILVYPLLIGGLLRVIDAAENGRPTHATAVFDTFRAGQGGARLIGFGVLITVIYIGVFVLILRLFGPEVWSWYWNLLETAQTMQPGQAPPNITLPQGLGTVLALGTIFGMFATGVYAIGFGQAALGGRGVGAALGDGVAGTLKNVFPILVLAALALAGFFALALVVGAVSGILMLLGSLVHQALGLLLVLPVYFGMILVMYVVMFGAMYFMWRDICGDAPADAPPMRNDRVEL